MQFKDVSLVLEAVCGVGVQTRIIAPKNLHMLVLVLVLWQGGIAMVFLEFKQMEATVIGINVKFKGECELK